MAWADIQSPQDQVPVCVSHCIFHHSCLCSLGCTTLASLVPLAAASALLAWVLAIPSTGTLCPQASVTASFLLFKRQFKCHLLTLTSTVPCSTQTLFFVTEHIPQSLVILLIYLFVVCVPSRTVNFLRIGTSSLLFSTGNCGTVAVKHTCNKYLLNKLIKNESL